MGSDLIVVESLIIYLIILNGGCRRYLNESLGND